MLNWDTEYTIYFLLSNLLIDITITITPKKIKKTPETLDIILVAAIELFKKETILFLFSL